MDGNFQMLNGKSTVANSVGEKACLLVILVRGPIRLSF